MKFRYLLFALFSLLLAFSCQTSYIPNGPTVPLMSQGDETQIGLKVGGNGYGASLAYSPYYHWVVFGNGNTYSIVQDSNNAIRYKHIFGEIGTGYYTRINKYWRFEVLGGFGMGATGLPSDRPVYRRAFIQPSFGISGPMIDMALSLRPVWLQHFETKTTVGPVEYNNSSMYLEPYFTFRGGYENIKFQFQTGYSMSLGTPALPSRGFMVHIGVHLTLVKEWDRYYNSPD